MMLAAFYGRADIVAMLLKRGANPNVVCPRGETALRWARENKHFEVAALLQPAGERQ
jgi:ankyrin repeat protein